MPQTSSTRRLDLTGQSACKTFSMWHLQIGQRCALMWTSVQRWTAQSWHVLVCPHGSSIEPLIVDRQIEQSGSSAASLSAAGASCPSPASAASLGLG